MDLTDLLDPVELSALEPWIVHTLEDPHTGYPYFIAKGSGAYVYVLEADPEDRECADWPRFTFDLDAMRCTECETVEKLLKILAETP